MISDILRRAFGHSARLLSCAPIADGYRNAAYRVICDAHDKPLFLKIEKSFDIPRTQRFQIKRELAGITLCRRQSVPVPRIVAHGVDDAPPWILEEFEPGTLASERNFTAEDAARISRQFTAIFEKMCAVRSDCYGDTFSGGLIGRHARWRDVLARQTERIFQDCLGRRVFGNAEAVVGKALALALTFIDDRSQSVLRRCDLFSANVMVAPDEEGRIGISCVIDFGMSLFAPLSFSRHQTQKYSDLRLIPSDCPALSKEAERACEILRLEPILMLHCLQYQDRAQMTAAYVQGCRDFLDAMG